jgi:acyl dehydratase
VSWEPPRVGERATWTRTFEAADVELFAQLSGDRNPLHFDPDYAAATRVGRLVVQGGLTTGLFNALVAMELPGPGSVFLHQEWDYPAPVYIGDTVTAHAEVIEARADKPITKLHCVARNQAGPRSRGECLVYTMRPDASAELTAEDPRRWRLLAIVATGELLAMSVVRASAVALLIGSEWGWIGWDC